ncbi:glycosyltransferase [Crocinitomicaceae bacterium]|nr:glycosyltransferase [Crocinitomicaceae bacterium]
MSKKTILFLLDNPYSNDRRVMREAEALNQSGDFTVQVIATFESNFSKQESINGVQVDRLFLSDIKDVKNLNAHSKYAEHIADKYDFDSIHAHDQVMLSIAVKLKRITGKKVTYDSHELFRCWPLNTKAKGFTMLKSKIVRTILIKREAKNIKKIDGLITVNESIRNDLNTNFKLDVPSISIRNVPEIPPVSYKSNILREEFNIENSTNLLVYIGNNVYPNTINIEQVIDEFSNQPNTVFVIISQLNWAQKEVEKYVNSIKAKNIFFRDVVPPEKIPMYLSSADVGIVSSWNKKDLSYWYGLDNKLFEYMMSEVPILATRQPEYLKIVEEHRIGECINPELENFYTAFQRIIEKKETYKSNITKTKTILNWACESKTLIEFYQNHVF